MIATAISSHEPERQTSECRFTLNKLPPKCSGHGPTPARRYNPYRRKSRRDRNKLPDWLQVRGWLCFATAKHRLTARAVFCCGGKIQPRKRNAISYAWATCDVAV